MFNHRELRLSRGQSGGDGGGGGYLACYSVVIACASLLMLSVLASKVSIAKACAFAAAAAVLFGAIGCVSRRCGGDAGGRATLPTTAAEAAASAARAPAAVCATCGLMGAAIDALPAFAYARPATEAGGGGGSKSGRSALCSVCLENVQAGEVVRQLPACRHLFHVDCIDMWLHSHSTCPLCRCNVSPPAAAVVVKAAATTTAAAEPPSADALPPV
ncbi:hypothetical protein GUJ93_ZPchr0002g23675 [Zizania palustris]|uniref:RING-type E3 ubiquitin transferase n=1 Tax=Zizania palustris TaxID=103762 RepID=A0A8J5S5H8_ZIZPA|nr:hypothetical protein GUJ93_ZPchr0002g23675 [Zizania palustris]